MTTTVTGSSGNDVLVGDQNLGDQFDEISGLAGNDIAYGGNANGGARPGRTPAAGRFGAGMPTSPDREAGTGDDGHDIVTGFEGVDTLYGGAGNDTLSGGPSIDTLYGDAGNDVIVLNVGAGRDTIMGFTVLSPNTATLPESDGPPMPES